MEAVKSLWKDPQLSPKMVFAGQKIFSDKTLKNRIFTELYTAKWWHILQVKMLPTCPLFPCINVCLVSSSSRCYRSSNHHCNRQNPTYSIFLTKPLIPFTLPLGIFLKRLVENLQNTHVSSSPIFQSRRWIVPG